MEGKINGGKKNRGFWSVIFSRTSFIVLLLLVQIAIIVALALRLREHFALIYALFTIAGFFVVIYIVNTGNNKPEFKLAWILPILLLPVFGTGYYIYTKLEGSTKKLRSNLDEAHFKAAGYLTQDPQVTAELRRANAANSNLAYYTYRELGYPIYQNTQATFLGSGEEIFAELIKQLQGARKFIFMEYFIVSKGYMWDTIRDTLAQKAAEGVEVRFMYDGMNVISQLPHRYPRELEALGIRTRVFSPLRPVFATYQNNRDHRKICVVDGVVGFTGGINLADEYINEKERFGHWKDSGVMLVGDAVQSLTMMFLEMWNATKPGQERWKRYLTPKLTGIKDANAFVMPFGDSPYYKENVGEQVYFHMLEHAKKYVHIMTPYLVLDNDMINHMTYAAKSGIEVIIIMPHIPDKWYAFALAKTYYEELISAGVQIYEYTPGFVHAKEYISDDESAVVGTINCDYRSLFLHFECAAFLYRSPAVRQAEYDFKKTLEKCQRVSIVDCRQTGFFMKVAGRVLRLFAPLL